MRDERHEPVRAHVYKGFSDKLSPAERWLDHQVGRPWDAVRSELFARFDARTVAGRHVLYGHILEWVEGRWYHARKYEVDAGGVLRRLPRRARTRRHACRHVSGDAWVGERRVGERGESWFWFVPTRPDEPRYRQDRRLTEEELTTYRSLCACAAKRITLTDIR